LKALTALKPIVLVFLCNGILLESPHEYHSKITQHLLQIASMKYVDSEVI